MDSHTQPIYAPFGGRQLPGRRFGPFGRWAPPGYDFESDYGHFPGHGGVGFGPIHPGLGPRHHMGRHKGRRHRLESTSSSSSSSSSSDSEGEKRRGRSQSPAKKHGDRHHGKHHRGGRHGSPHGQRHGSPHGKPHHGRRHHHEDAVDLQVQAGLVEKQNDLPADAKRLELSDAPKPYKVKLHELRRFEPSDVAVYLSEGKLHVKATRTKEGESRSVTRTETHVITIPEDVNTNSLQVKLIPGKGLLVVGPRTAPAVEAAADAAQ